MVVLDTWRMKQAEAATAQKKASSAVADLERKQNRLTDLLTDGLVSPDECRRQRDRIDGGINSFKLQSLEIADLGANPFGDLLEPARSLLTDPARLRLDGDLVTKQRIHAVLPRKGRILGWKDWNPPNVVYLQRVGADFCSRRARWRPQRGSNPCRRRERAVS